MAVTIIEQPRFSCALAAQQTVLAIPRALPIVHAGPGCSAKISGFAVTGAGHQGEGFGGGSQVSSTNTSESEVVFGGEDKLRDLIGAAMKVLNGDLYVVLSGCTSGIIGDDVAQVASDFKDEGHPILGVDTSGFKGNSYVGHELVIQEIIRQFVGNVTPNVRKGTVNLFSVVPYQNPFWRFELEELKRILNGIGFRVNVLFGAGSAGVSEWKDIPNAQFNLVLNSWVGLETAQLLKEQYKTPYLHIPYLPVGAKAASGFLRTVTEFAGADKGKTEAFIAAEEKRFYNYFVDLADFISELHNNIPYELYTVADSTYALGVSDYLVNELGFEPKGVYVTDDPNFDSVKIIEETFRRFGPEFEGKLTLTPDGGQIQQHIIETLAGSKKALIMGSAWEDDLAKETRNLSVHLSLPLSNDVIITRGFAGYNGGLRLTEEIYAGVFRRGNIAQTTQTL